MKLELVHCDTCLPDYWSGHHKAHLQITIWPGMSLRDIKSQLRNELIYGAIAGSDDLARLLSAHMVKPEEEKQADRAMRAAYAAINRLSPAKKNQRRFFTDLEQTPDDDGCDQVCAFFVFCEI